MGKRCQQLILLTFMSLIRRVVTVYSFNKNTHHISYICTMYRIGRVLQGSHGRARTPRRAGACTGGVFSPRVRCGDLLLRDMPPSAWLLIAPGLQESRPSGTDVADGDREPFKHHLMTADPLSPGTSRAPTHRHIQPARGSLRPPGDKGGDWGEGGTVAG